MLHHRQPVNSNHEHSRTLQSPLSLHRKLCRSVIAEYLLRARGMGRFESYSAGAIPAGKVNPYTIEVLDRHFNIDASQARSKSWEEYRCEVRFRHYRV